MYLRNTLPWLARDLQCCCSCGFSSPRTLHYTARAANTVLSSLTENEIMGRESDTTSTDVMAMSQTKKSDWKRRQDGSQFVDAFSLSVQSGNGGSGGVSFHREKYVEKGPPSGGAGGKGGDVFILASQSVNSLSHIKKVVKGGVGGSGGAKWLSGKRGEDTIIRVPVGTVVREIKTVTESDIQAIEEELEELDMAQEVSDARLGEASSRVTRWDSWKLDCAQRDMRKEKHIPFKEAEEVQVDDKKMEALKRVRSKLFVMFPQAEIAGHAPFMREENRLIKARRKLLRGKLEMGEAETAPLHLDLDSATPLASPISLCVGGTPGLGNASFQRAEDRSPKYATRGGDGTSMKLYLELKTAGDVGLVGMPNAGKSTILRAVTSSTPRIASYAFTTLNPHHGTCVVYSDGTFSGPTEADEVIGDTERKTRVFSGSTDDEKAQAARALAERTQKGKVETMRFTITDNPGLVEQSSENVGLGHAFLRHVERCSALVHVVDLSLEDPVKALSIIRKELTIYAEKKGLGIELLRKVKGVVANKADLFRDTAPSSTDDLSEDERQRLSSAEDGQQKLSALREYVAKMTQDDIDAKIRAPGDDIWILPLSAKRRVNTVTLIRKLADTVQKERLRAAKMAERDRAFSIQEKTAALEQLIGLGERL